MIYELPCKICSSRFLWCWKRGGDFRCDQCRKGTSVEAVEKELENMSAEEYQSFIKDIEEYEKNSK